MTTPEVRRLKQEGRKGCRQMFDLFLPMVIVQLKLTSTLRRVSERISEYIFETIGKEKPCSFVQL